MASSAPTSPLRQLFDRRSIELLREVEDYVDALLSSRTLEVRQRARREMAEQLNQSARLLTQAASLDELGATLLDATAPFAKSAALFRVDAGRAAGERIRGAGVAGADKFKQLSVSLEAAAALAGAVETREPVIAAAAPPEVPAEIVELLGHGPQDRVAIFPLVVAGNVPAALYVWGDAENAAIEMLALMAASLWNIMAKPASPGLVTIAPAEDAGSAWSRLSGDEQRMHLRAQRFARVQVAEIRLHHAAEVQAGRARHDLYGYLRAQLDAARESFREKFFAACPSMVDYLHLEVQRTLANEDPESLGKEYPGPMV